MNNDSHVDVIVSNQQMHGMAALMYTDPTITPGVTLIRATHFDQLRAGLQ